MKKLKDDLQKHTLQLFAGDYKKLQDLNPEVGAAHVLRNILRAYLLKVDPPVNTSKIKGDLDV
jgi:hypothetical protein